MPKTQRSNPLFQSTTPQSQEETETPQQEEVPVEQVSFPQTMPTVIVSEPAVVVPPPPSPPQTPTLPVPPMLSREDIIPSPVQPQSPSLPMSLPPGPPVYRKKHKNARFTDIYRTRSMSIDRRLLPYWDDFMESGDTKTALANQIVLKLLLDLGYNIDPDILQKPIKLDPHD